MTLRRAITLITLLLLVGVIALGWPEIKEAWGLLGRVDLWILALMVPVQVLSYYATGEVMFSYLRSKGEIKSASRWSMARLALELNFVNHVLPSGIAAAFAYAGWVLARWGVGPGRATMAQMIRHAIIFAAYVLLLVISFGVLLEDREVNKMITVTSAGLVVTIVSTIVGLVWATSNQQRLMALARWTTRVTNATVSLLTLGKRREALRLETVVHFLDEVHDDYLAIRGDGWLLLKPFLWGVVVNILDIALLYIAFASLGIFVRPALIVIAFGLSSVISTISVAPGGAGVYEAAMILFLASAGVSRPMAIAGTLLARVVLLLGTVLFGYVFYQLTINKHGRAPA